MAPASLARSTSSRCENAVRMTTGARCLAAICSAAEIPSSTGILTSRIIRSGRRLDASSTACSPSDAWPAISYPSSSSISFRSSRISASSSAITTRTGVGLTATSVPKAVDWRRSRLSLPAEMASQAPVDQSAESAVSNTVQCGFESHPGHPVISQDIEDTVNPHWSRCFRFRTSWFAGGLVVAAGVEGQVAEQFAGGGADDADVEVLNQQQDVGLGVSSADADVVEAAAVAQGDGTGGIDLVGADPVVGVGGPVAGGGLGAGGVGGGGGGPVRQ